MGYERRLILPSRHQASELGILPLIFLAGPIGDAPEWHNDAVNILQNLKSEKRFYIASPHEMMDSLEGYDYQIDWELDHMQRAVDNGCLLFWFANQKTKSERAYAQTSRVEFGEALGGLKRKKFNISVGADYGFDGDYYIKYRLGKIGVPLLRSLEDTCRYAVDSI